MSESTKRGSSSLVLVFMGFGLLAILAGGALLAVAKSAIHEIESFILFLVGAVFWSSAGIIGTMEDLLRKESGSAN